MSEQEQEQTQEEEAPPEAEPIEQPGGPQEEPEPQPDVGPGPHPVTPPETEAEIEELYTRLETRAKNYVKSVSELVAGKGLPAVPCEMCADAYPGLRWLEPRDDNHAAMIAVSGTSSDSSPLSEDPDAQQCDRCHGWGWTRLPSRVPGNEQRLCKRCNGAGYLDTNPQSGSLQAPVAEPENGTAELLPGVAEDDPSVVDLRARGYTIIPPMQIGATSEGQ